MSELEWKELLNEKSALHTNLGDDDVRQSN